MRKRPLPICAASPETRELNPLVNNSGLLTPTAEDFNEFLIHSRRLETKREAGNTKSYENVVVAVVGVGYVGYQLVQAFSKHYPVIAFDVSKARIEAVRQDLEVRSVYLTCDPTNITQATHILIAVPTTIHQQDKSIDTSHLKCAIDTLAQHARPGAVVIMESSVAVGMTRSLLGSLSSMKGFRAGMSPERVDPGRTNMRFEAIPKVISGLNNEALRAIKQLYEPVFDQVVPVSSCEVAEMTKLYENCQRMIGIAYANEMADACQSLGIDPTEVCSAAGTKPFGYQPYLPGAGVGGHCIPVNPYYLLSNLNFPLLQAATEKMWQRPAALVDQVMASMQEMKKDRRKSYLNRSQHENVIPTGSLRILIVGTAFKPGQSATSHSPGIAMIDHVTTSYSGVHLDFCEPLVNAEAVPGAVKIDHTSDWNIAILERNYDAIIVAMAQRGLDFNILTLYEIHKFSISLRRLKDLDHGVPHTWSG